MSIEVIAKVLKKKWGSPSRKLVALKLADVANEDGSSIFPAVQTVADECELSKRQVQRTIAEFRADDLLVLVKEGGSGPKDTTEYRFNMDAIEELPDAKNKDDTMSPLREAKGDTQSQKGCHHVTQPVLKPSLSNERGDSGSSEPGDKSPFQKKSDEVWTVLPPLLRAQNPNDKQNRSLIGQWQKRTPSIEAKDKLLTFAKAAHGTPEPISYISAAMNDAFPKRAGPKDHGRPRWEVIARLAIEKIQEAHKRGKAPDLGKIWGNASGPMPGKRGCLVPKDLQQKVLAALEQRAAA